MLVSGLHNFIELNMTQKLIRHLSVSPGIEPIPLWLPQNAKLLGVGNAFPNVAIAYEEPVGAALWKSRYVLVVYEAQTFDETDCERRFLGWTSLDGAIVYVFELLK